MGGQASGGVPVAASLGWSNQPRMMEAQRRKCHGFLKHGGGGGGREVGQAR
jgi:hypothetical protein